MARLAHAGLIRSFNGMSGFLFRSSLFLTPSFPRLLDFLSPLSVKLAVDAGKAVSLQNLSIFSS